MQADKEFLKEKGFIPYISFKRNPKHQVTLESSKKHQIKNDKNEDVFGILYKVKENSEDKQIFTSSVSLIQQLSQFNENDEVMIEMKSKKGQDGGWKTYFVVIGVDGQVPIKDINSEEIPVIQEENNIKVEDIPF